jgi:hypothetical protein
MITFDYDESNRRGVVSGDPDVIAWLTEHFSYENPGAKFARRFNRFASDRTYLITPTGRYDEGLVFVFKDAIVPPYRLNTRIYSCILLKNSLPYRWRGMYNEDTDLSIRALKDGWCTMLFNSFLANKETTMRAKGGNTDELYKQTNNRLEFAKSLHEQHPDVVDVVQKFGRWHHQVNYKPFKKNRLVKKGGLSIKQGVNNYGMVIKEYEEKMHISKILKNNKSKLYGST